jgi:hypothetical protein
MVSTDCYKVYVKVSNLAIKSTVYRNSVVFNDKLFSQDKNRIFDHSDYCERESWKMRVISPQYGFDYDEDENSKTLRKTKMFYSFENQKKKTWIYFFRIRFIESSHLIFSRVDQNQKESWNHFVWNEKEKKKKVEIILFRMRKKRKRKLKSFCLEWERKEKET